MIAFALLKITEKFGSTPCNQVLTSLVTLMTLVAT